MNRLMNIYNRIRNFDPSKLTPVQIIVGVAAALVGLWVIWMIVQALLTLVPIAAGILAIYLAYRWLSSRSEDIPAEMTKSKNERVVEEAVANFTKAASGIFGSEDEEQVVVKEDKTAAVIEEAAVEKLAYEEPSAEDDEKLVVKQVINPETGFKEPDISRLIEREEEKLKEADRVNEEVLSQIEERRRRLLGKNSD